MNWRSGSGTTRTENEMTKQQTQLNAALASENTTNTVKGGYLALGMQGDKCVVLAKLSNSIETLCASDMTEMRLKAVCGADWCDRVYTEGQAKKTAFNLRRLASDIIRDCQAKGPFAETQTRKAGVWGTNDGANLIVNGAELWHPDGTTLERGVIDGRVYPADRDIGFGLETAPASPADVDAVLKLFGAIKWRQALGAELLLGWLGVAVLAGALPRRPHIYITGPAGCGKSTLLALVGNLTSRLARRATGKPTLAALYQRLGGSAAPFILDEFEPDSDIRGGADVLEVARISYSLQEGDEGIIRGTASGESRHYAFYSPFMAAGITPGKFQPSDLSRWVTLEAMGFDERNTVATQPSDGEAREIGGRLARLIVSRWSVVQANLGTVRAAMLEAGADARMADTLGTLLATYWAFVSEQPASPDDAQFLAGSLELEARMEDRRENDEQRCLDALLSHVQPFQFVDGETLALTRKSLSIGEAVTRVCQDPTGTTEISERLAQLGLRVAVRQGKNPQMYIANSPEHQQLRRFFRGTKWAYGGWSTVLRRLPGGTESTQRLGAGTKACKVTMFDVPQELVAANDEAPEQFLAA